MISKRVVIASTVIAAWGLGCCAGQSVFTSQEVPSIPGSSTLWSRCTWAINNSGQVVGFQMIRLDGSTYRTRGYIWSGGNSILTLPPDQEEWSSNALGVNDRGDVVGAANYASGLSGGCFLSGDGPSFFQVWEETSEAFGVNSSGVAVGAMKVSGVRHAFYYDTEVHDLGSLGGQATNKASAINDAGVIVGSADFGGGTHAFLATTTSAMVDLNSLLPANSGWVLKTANDINRHGVIVGEGLFNGAQSAYKFDPSSGDPPEALTPLSGNNRGHALAINAAGVVVGFSNFVNEFGGETTGFATAWAYGNAVQIDLVVDNYGGPLWVAHDINDWGQVIATFDFVNFDVRLSPLCRADLNMDGFLLGDDLDLFSQLFEDGEPGADYDVNGFVNADDYDAFVSDFEAGC